MLNRVPLIKEFSSSYQSAVKGTTIRSTIDKEALPISQLEDTEELMTMNCFISIIFSFIVPTHI